MPKRKTIINFTFNGEIRQIIPDFQKLNLEHKYDIDIGMTALAGFICIHGFKKRAKNIQIKCFTNVGETVAKFFITFVICLVETKAAESPHTYYSTYEKKVLSVKKRLLEILNHNIQIKQSNQARLPASGDENERCGEISAIHKCMVCGNTYPLYHSCHRIECPICYKSAAARIGQHASVKIRANIKAIDKEITPKPAKDVYRRNQKDAGLWDQAYNKTEVEKLHAILKHGGVRHLVVSVPPNEREKWQEFSNRLSRNSE